MELRVSLSDGGYIHGLVQYQREAIGWSSWTHRLWFLTATCPPLPLLEAEFVVHDLHDLPKQAPRVRLW